MTASNKPRIKHDWQSLRDELDSSTGRSIVEMAPDLAGAIRSSKNALEAEGRLLATLSSQKATQHERLTRPVLNSKSKMSLPSVEWINGLPPSPERERLREQIERRRLGWTIGKKLPLSAAHLKCQLLDAAGHPQGRERQPLNEAQDVIAQLTGGFPVTSEIFAAIVNKLAALAPQLPRSEDSATARQARRQRAKLGLSRPPGRPPKSGQL
jgi:hypothetical protein